MDDLPAADLLRQLIVLAGLVEICQRQAEDLIPRVSGAVYEPETDAPLNRAAQLQGTLWAVNADYLQPAAKDLAGLVQLFDDSEEERSRLGHE